ncbi:MAG: prolyl oligopeptidase family serine peptidase [Planctomycetota bacterium]|nr:prolyl oligopeptidase family serine peptidase [Planctomycetota bacterium]
MKNVLYGLAVISLLSAGCGVVGPEDSEFARTHSVPDQALQVWIEVPEGAPPESGWPLLLFLHGAGERGKDLTQVKVHGPPRLVGELAVLREFVLVAPLCPQDEWWEARSLKSVLDKVLETLPVDPDRLCVTGLSMGGYGTWELLAHYPDFFAAAVPICGGGDPTRLWPEVSADFDLQDLMHAKDVALRVYHGEHDSIVPVEESHLLVEALRAEGGDVEFTIYPDGGHDSWTRTYARPELYMWMLEQRRSLP